MYSYWIICHIISGPRITSNTLINLTSSSRWENADCSDNLRSLLLINIWIQTAEMMSLPDDLLAVLDEFSDARSEALDNKVTTERDASHWFTASHWLSWHQAHFWHSKVDCEVVYDECPSETIVHILKKIKNVMWRLYQDTTVCAFGKPTRNIKRTLVKFSHQLLMCAMITIL